MTDFTEENAIVKLLKKCYIKQLTFKFTSWKGTNPRSQNILSGLQILENQKKRRDAQKLKAKKSTARELVNQEKAFTIITRTIKRLRKQALLEAFISLLKHQVKHEKVKFYLNIKTMRIIRNIFKA